MAKYIDQKKIGTGGFGEVWECTREEDGPVFAKKKLQSNIDSDGIKRFAIEVRILSSLDHPNIIKVIGKRLQKEPFFYIMPCYSMSLKDEISNLQGDTSRITLIYSSILDGIEYAHQQGVIHRDLKPENILLNSDTDIVVSDFGLGRIISSDSTRQTMTGLAMGSFLYMPPEQLTNAKNADEISDIYSLGRILYELYNGPITSFTQDTSSLPPGIAFFINKCTQNNPANRFQTLNDLKHAWLSLFNSSSTKSEIDELMSLRTTLTPPADYTDSDVERFYELISKHQEDQDLLHETIMQIDPIIIGDMSKIHISETRQIIDKFIKSVTNQSWSFSYTDKIGNKCKGLYHSIDDYDLRTSILICALDVGTDHNRWHVMEIVSNLIEAPKDTGEDLVLQSYLEQVAEWKLERVGNYISVGKLPRAIQHFFE